MPPTLPGRDPAAGLNRGLESRRYRTAERDRRTALHPQWSKCVATRLPPVRTGRQHQGKIPLAPRTAPGTMALAPAFAVIVSATLRFA
ncbi:MAG: hypothetical protein WCL04_07725 [Verrucomicrobiota bacterium]